MMNSGAHRLFEDQPSTKRDEGGCALISREEGEGVEELLSSGRRVVGGEA